MAEENADAYEKASEELAEKEEVGMSWLFSVQWEFTARQALENAIQKQQELMAQMNLVSGELNAQVVLPSQTRGC